jgi:hypothetical protein
MIDSSLEERVFTEAAVPYFLGRITIVRNAVSRQGRLTPLLLWVSYTSFDHSAISVSNEQFYILYSARQMDVQNFRSALPSVASGRSPGSCEHTPHEP